MTEWRERKKDFWERDFTDCGNKSFILESFAFKWVTVRMHIHTGLFSYTHETHKKQ